MSDQELTNEQLQSVSGAGPKPGMSDPLTVSDKKDARDELSKKDVGAISGGGPKPGMAEPRTASDKKDGRDELSKQDLGAISGGLSVSSQQGNWNVAPSDRRGRNERDELDLQDVGRIQGGATRTDAGPGRASQRGDLSGDIIDERDEADTHRM